MRTCDDDGRIRHVDRPLALVDSCLFGEPARGERLAWATTTSTRDGKVWTYVVAINTVHRAPGHRRPPRPRSLGLDGYVCDLRLATRRRRADGRHRR